MTRRTAIIFAVLAAVLSPAFAFAQAQPPSYGMPISTDDAKAVAAAAVAEAQTQGWRMAIAIVDPGGHLVYFEKMQDTQTGSVDVAIEKARASVLFRRPTRAHQDALASGGEGLRVLGLPGAVPVEGGVPILMGGKVVGAIGVSGGTSEQDGQVAQAGVGAVR